MSQSPPGERIASIEAKLDSLLELKEPLQKMSDTVIRHEEKWKNLDAEVLPGIKSEVEASKKFRWRAGGAYGVIAFLAALFGKHAGG